MEIYLKNPKFYLDLKNKFKRSVVIMVTMLVTSVAVIKHPPKKQLKDKEVCVPS